MGEKPEFPDATIVRLVKTIVPEIRVGSDAIPKINEKLMKCLTGIAEEATKLAKHAGRKTIKEEDVTAID
jgi:histone H3/H4